MRSARSGKTSDVVESAARDAIVDVSLLEETTWPR
jgi:hypothetical protein